MLKEFQEFAMKGNLVDMAVGFVMGTAFATVVTAFIQGVFLPILSPVMGGIDFSSIAFTITPAQLDADGNVGVGTDNPLSMLHVDNGGVRVNAPDSMTIGGTTPSNGAIFIDQGGSLQLGLDGNEIWFGGNGNIGSQGNLTLIGNGAAADYTATLKESSHTSGQLVLNAPNGYSSIELLDNGSKRWWIGNHESADTLYIRDMENNNGVVLAQDTNSWSSISDARFKKDIDQVSVLDRIDGFEYVRFKWKDNDRVDFGVVAQDVYKVFPEVVHKGDDELSRELTDMSDPGAWSVMYDKLGAIALQAIKELKAENDALRAEFEAFKAAHQ